MRLKKKTPEKVIRYEETQYGFLWGAADVQRCFSDKKKGWVTLLVTTPQTSIQIYVTRTGKIRIHDPLCEWKPS